MKRTPWLLTISKLLVLILSLFVLIVFAFFTLLQSQYSTKTINTIFSHFDIPVQAQHAEYEFPYHLKLTDLVLFPNTESPHSVGKLEIWLNEQVISNNQIQLDSILLAEVSLQQGAQQIEAIQDHFAQSRLISWINVHQIAMTQFDYSDGQLIGRGIDVQIESPKWPSEEQSIPFGNIQFAAKQLYWKQQAINDLLFDLDYRPHASTLYGASFEWEGAQFSGQAEHYDTGWSLVNVTVDKLNLNTDTLRELNQNFPLFSDLPIHHINSLDIRHSNIEWQSTEIENLDLSIENIQINQSMWQQQQGQLSLSADNIQHAEHQLISPTLSATFDENSITLHDFSGQLYEGSIHTSGTIKPSELTLEKLSLTGMKATLNQQLQTLFFQHEQWDSVTIEHLSVENGQLIQIAQKPYWQATGFDISAQNLQLKHQGKLGFWQGELSASANSISYSNIIGTQGIVEMTSRDGLWQLDRAYIPLEQGYIEAFAQYQFNQISQPWRLNLATDGLPIDVINTLYPLPFTLSGYSELNLDLSGLGGDKLMLSHSLSGELSGNIRGATIAKEPTTVELNETEAEKRDEYSQAENRINISPIEWLFERGKGRLQPVAIESVPAPQSDHAKDNQPEFGNSIIEGEMEGEVDLLIEKNVLSLHLEWDCQLFTGNLYTGEINHSERCPQRLVDDSANPSDTHE